MTESYSNHSVLFEYYKSGAEIPTNFNLLARFHNFPPKKFETEIENWISRMPMGATYNSVVLYILL